MRQVNREDTGVVTEDKAAVLEELQLVEEDLAELRGSMVGLREQIGERSDGATDPADTAAVLTTVEEQEALIGVLEGRRSELRRRLDQG